MNINLTLIAQLVSFAVFVWFTMKFVWPPLVKAMDERKAKIAEGLAAAERGQHEQELAEKRAKDTLHQAKQQAAEIKANAEKQASMIVEEQIDIVGMKMSDDIPMLVNQFGNGEGFIRHRLDILVQANPGAMEMLDDFPGLGTGDHKIRFLAGERFQAKRHLAVGERRQDLLQHLRGIALCLLMRDPRQQISLLWRTEHHQRASQIAAESGQFRHVVRRALSYVVLWRGEVETFRFGEQPVQSDHFQSRFPGCRRIGLALLGSDVPGSRSQGKGGHFDPCVPCFRNEITLALPVPVNEQFLADGIFHDVTPDVYACEFRYGFTL